MKVIALKPEESETLERAFYEADSYERLISVLGRHLNAEASADAKDIIMHYAEPCRASQMKLKMVQDKIISRYTEHEDEIKRFWFDIARGEYISLTRKRHEDYSNMVQRLYAGDDISVNHALCRNITFQVTSGCNLRCSYCYEHHKGAEHMSIETGRKIVDYLLDLYEQGDSDFINRNTRAVVLDFIGGEPLLEASLIEKICDYWFAECWRRKIPLAPFTRISFATNGKLWFSPEARHLFDKYHEMMSVTISIDGVQELHDKYRVDEHGAGSFSLAWSAFQDAKHRFGWLNSKMTFVPGSFRYIADSIKMMLDEGCTDIACNYAYEPVYTPADGRTLYEQMKTVSDHIVSKQLDVSITMLDSILGGKTTSDTNFCGGTGAMMSFAPDGSAYPCIRYAPISIGEEKSKKVRFGSVYDGLYTTDAQRRAKAELDAITLTSQSEQKCIDCPVSAGCGWCSGLNYEMYGTANKRFTGICWAHKARVLASAYYHNRRYIVIGDCLPIKAALSEADALEILPAADYEEFLEIERAALLKFADENGIS